MYLNMCTQCSLQFQCISLRPSIPVWAIWGGCCWLCQSRGNRPGEGHGMEQAAVAAASDVNTAGAALFCKRAGLRTCKHM